MENSASERLLLRAQITFCSNERALLDSTANQISYTKRYVTFIKNLLSNEANTLRDFLVV